MPSDLYRQALDSLSEDDREALGRGLDWLRTHTGLSPARPTDGARICENLQTEAHLVGDRAFGEPTELKGFLQRCAAGLAASSVPDRHRGYEEACEEFAGRGLQVPRTHLPDGLFRYTSSRTLAARLIERTLGTRARDAFDRGTLPPQTAFTRIQGRWEPLRLGAADRLGRGDKIFATFEHPAGAPRDDATAMSQALALPLWQAPRSGLEILIELAYATDMVADYRFPTVADAGWTHLFQPAAEDAPDSAKPASCCGWTEPLGPYPAQPEIIHDNAPLQVLSGPPRLVGEIP